MYILSDFHFFLKRFWCIIFDMVNITISKNQGEQRLDRFLKKYFPKASLGHIYKMIRKDVKVNGRRKKPETVLNQGDEVCIYIDECEKAALQADIGQERQKVKKQFSVIYEDENILVADKPFGLLTHGDSREKKNHLANQVLSYMIEKGEYDPRIEKTFIPAPANRLDRNTTGIVLFGKNMSSLRELNRMFRERNEVEKLYLTIVSGKIENPLFLKSSMIKDDSRNLTVSASGDGKVMETDIVPLMYSTGKKIYTLTEANIHTGRTHQIRFQLSEAGFPIIGDSKYGNAGVNRVMKDRYGLTTQLLHAYKIKFLKIREGSPLEYLAEKEFECDLPKRFERIKNEIFG